MNTIAPSEIATATYWAASTRRTLRDDAGLVMQSHERLRLPVQLADPVPSLERRRALAGLDLSILPDADSDQPGWATNPETLTLPTALHHPRVRGQGRHDREPRTNPCRT
jgi:hypothetical protein